MAPPGLSVLGAKGSVRDRLTPPGRVEGSALGRYEVPFHWGGTAPLAPFFIPPLATKTIQPPCGLRKCIPPLVAGATTLSAGKRVTGFSVAYGSLRIQFPCHPVGSMSLDSRVAYSSPMNPVPLPPPLKRWDYECLAMGSCLYRKAWSRLFCPPDGGKVRRSRIRESRAAANYQNAFHDV